MKKSSTALRGAVALFALACIYGFIGFFSRELAPGLSLWQQMYIRLILAVPFLWLTFRSKISLAACLTLVKTEPWLVILRAICLFSISVPLYFYATTHTKLGNAALLQVLPYTFILGVLVNHDKLTKQKVGLMLVALFGAYLIGVKSGFDFSNLGTGELASMFSGMLFSLGYVTRKKHKAKVNDFELSLTIVTTALVVVTIISIISGDGLPHPAAVNLRFWILLVAAGYLNAFIILLSNYGFRRVKDTIASNIMVLEGTFAVLFGYLIYHEIPTLREIIGAIIILIAAVSSAYIAKEVNLEKTKPKRSTVQIG